jgi:hypothetical protein
MFCTDRRDPVLDNLDVAHGGDRSSTSLSTVISPADNLT